MSAKKNAIKNLSMRFAGHFASAVACNGRFHAERLAVACEASGFFVAVSILDAPPQEQPSAHSDDR